MKAKLFFAVGAVLFAACGAEDMEDAGAAGVLEQAASRPADLYVSLQGPTSVTSGQSTGYTLQLRNLGGQTAVAPQVSVPLPAGVRVASVGSGCVADTTRVRCSYSNLGASGSVNRSFTLLQPAAAGSYALTATATTNSQEATQANNVSTLQVAVSAPPVAVPIVLQLPQAINAKACFGVSSYASCVPAALVEADLILNADNSITTFDPQFTGTWSQPTGPTSLRISFVEVTSGNTTIVYDGTGVSSSCVEGTGAGPSVPGAAFRACTY